MSSKEFPILQYYKNVVVVSSDDMENAGKLLNVFLQDFKAYRSERLEADRFGEPEIYGSVSEGLKVRAPDEFDLFLPLKTSARLIPRTVKTDPFFSHPTVPTVYNYLQQQAADSSSKAFKSRRFDIGPFYVKASDDQLFVDHAKVKKSVRSLLSRFFNLGTERSNSYAATVVTKHPAGITIQLTPRGWYVGRAPRKIFVNVIPIITSENTVGHGTYEGEYPENVATDASHRMWRQSFAFEEAGLWNHCVDENIKKALMIAKSLQLDCLQLQVVPSYVLKTIALHLVKEGSYRTYLKERLAEIFENLRKAAKTRTLKHAFRYDANLLEEYPEDEMEELASFLDKKMRKGMSSFFS